MVTQNEVWQAAARIRVRPAAKDGVKERVSVRTVRKELGGGSFGDIAKPLALWKEHEAYHPVIETAELPEAFEGSLVKLGMALLEQARIEVTRQNLPEYAAAAKGMARTRDILEEALAQVDHLEGQVARLEAELGRLRASAAPAPALEPASAPALARVAPDRELEGMRGFIDGLMDLNESKAMSEADAFWAEVRATIATTLEKRGPLPVHKIHRALPEKLRKRGDDVGLPLTPAWLRYHLLSMAKAGDGVSEADGRFALATVPPGGEDAPGDEDVDAVLEMGSLRFWRAFLREAYDVLRDHGPLPAKEILDRMDPKWVADTARFQAINEGRMRYKIRERIRYLRPFRELADGRFEAIPLDPPWDGRSAMPALAKAG